MAGSQSDPAALLRVLMKHGRMEQAAALALQSLRAWQTEVTFFAVSTGYQEQATVPQNCICESVRWCVGCVATKC